MMEVLFKAKEGDRDQQVHKLRIEIERHKQNLLKLDQQRFLTGEMDALLTKVKLYTLKQIDRLTIQMNDLEIADTAFAKYALYGISLLKDLTCYFQEAEPQDRRKLLGSIFPAKKWSFKMKIIEPAH